LHPHKAHSHSPCKHSSWRGTNAVHLCGSIITLHCKLLASTSGVTNKTHNMRRLCRYQQPQHSHWAAPNFCHHTMGSITTHTSAEAPASLAQQLPPTTTSLHWENTLSIRHSPHRLCWRCKNSVTAILALCNSHSQCHTHCRAVLLLAARPGVSASYHPFGKPYPVQKTTVP